MNPQPGVYYRVPAEEYRSWPYASKSRLLAFRKSPAHALLPDHPTAPKSLGTEAHAAVLEPDLFERMAVRCKTMHRGSREWKDIVAANPGKWLIQDDDWEAIIRIRDRILNHPKAGPLVRCKGTPEASIVFDDPITGVRCKARADRITAAGIVDIKTARSAEWRDFQYAADEYGYFLQSALYRRGVLARYGRTMPFIVIAVETGDDPVPPPGAKVGSFGVAVYILDGEHAERELDSALAQWRQCVETGEWPGYDERVLNLPEPPRAAYHYRRESSDEPID